MNLTNNNYIKIFYLSISILLAVSSPSSAQQFKSSVDKTTIGQNERFQVFFEFSGGDINNIKNFRAPTFKGLRVLGGPNQSSSMQFINGKVSGSLTYSYILIGPSLGTFTIGPASVYYDDKVYTSESITIKISKASGSISKGSTTGGISNAELAQNVFIRAIPNKNKAYIGEQITVSYKLYTRLNMSSPQINKLPTYKGFWVEELDMSNNISFKSEMYKGKRFRVAEIKRAALFPTKSGSLTVTPFELVVPVLIKKKRKSQDIFDDFFNDSFFGRTETIEFTARSNSVVIKVKSLPIQNVPESFHGAVGKFNFKTSLDKNEVELNDPVTFKIEVSGKGNIHLIDLPDLKLPAGFETYDPKNSESINRKNIVSGKKNVEYLVVPRVPGSKEIPPVEFSYFDPSSKKYITKRSKPFTINVKKGNKEYETAAAGFSKEDVKLLGQDIRFIKTSDYKLERKSELQLIQTWFWIFIVFPFLVLVSVLGIRKRQEKLTGNIQLMRYRKAEKEAKSKLKVAKKALEANDNSKFYEETSKALFGYLEDKLHIQKSEFTLDRAVHDLKAVNVEPDIIDNVKSIADKCEFARFAPENENNEAEKKLYDSAVKVIVDLENSSQRKKKKK